MKNVMLDVHVYLWVLDSFLHLHNLLPYQLLLRFYERQIQRAGRYTPVLVGEWLRATAWRIAMGNLPMKKRRSMA